MKLNHFLEAAKPSSCHNVKSFECGGFKKVRLTCNMMDSCYKNFLLKVSVTSVIINQPIFFVSIYYNFKFVYLTMCATGQ